MRYASRHFSLQKSIATRLMSGAGLVGTSVMTSSGTCIIGTCQPPYCCEPGSVSRSSPHWSHLVLFIFIFMSVTRYPPNNCVEPMWLAASVLPQGCGLFFGLVLTWLSFFRRARIRAPSVFVRHSVSSGCFRPDGILPTG